MPDFSSWLHFFFKLDTFDHSLNMFHHSGTYSLLDLLYIGFILDDTQQFPSDSLVICRAPNVNILTHVFLKFLFQIFFRGISVTLILRLFDYYFPYRNDLLRRNHRKFYPFWQNGVFFSFAMPLTLNLLSKRFFLFQIDIFTTPERPLTVAIFLPSVATFHRFSLTSGHWNRMFD